MRRATAFAATAAAVTALTLTLVAAGLRSSDGSGFGTSAGAMSPSGDGRAAPRTERATRRRAVETHGESAAENDDAPREPSCAGPPPPERRLRIVDSEGHPMEDVLVEPGDRRTDDDGVVDFSVVAPDAPPIEATFFDGRDVRRVTLEKPATDAVAADFPVLEVVVIDATTGRAVTAEAVYVALGGDCGSHETRVEPRRALRLPVTEMGDARLWVRVFEPPEGFATVRGFAWWGRVARAARRVRVVVPVWPVADWEFRALDVHGAALASAEVDCVVVPAAYGSELGREDSIEWMPRVRAVSDESGRVVVRGLPVLPVCAVTVRVFWPANGTLDAPRINGSVRGLRLDRQRPTEPLEVRLARPSCALAAEVPPNAREPADPPPPPGGDPNTAEQSTAVVCVLDADGHRVAGARVTPWSDGVAVWQFEGDTQVLTPRTGPDGCVRLAVPPGTVVYDVTLAGAIARCESADDLVTVTLRSP